MKTGSIVLLSGGLDSVAVLYHTATTDRVAAAISFDYGSKHNPRELPCAKWHCDKLGIPHIIIPLSFMNQHFESALLASGDAIPDGHYAEINMKQTVVPFRNGIMLAIAAGLAESKEAHALVIAAHAGDHAIYPDCREEFMQSMGSAIESGTYANIELRRPFIAMTKTDIVRRGHELGIDFARTWSCYKGGDLHCGTCGTCVERREAFLQAGIADPTVYEQEPPLPEAPAP
jgi:7-cyano-7-deazaguanine synthase